MNCVRPIMQGDSYFIPIKIKVNGEKIDIEKVSKIQFVFGNLTKFFGTDSEVAYNATEDLFFFPLTQEETFGFQGPQDLQVRVKFTDDTVVGRVYGKVDVMFGNTTEVI